MDRKKEFAGIQAALEDQLCLKANNALVAQGDSLAFLRKLPDHSVSLILTDPPYHATKKENIYGDTAFEEDQHYVEWMQQYATEWRRLLRTNGSFYCFCASEMAARLEVMFSKDFNILSSITWTKPNDPGFDGWKGKMKKESLRQWYPHSERIIFAEIAVEGNLHRSPFGDFLRGIRKKVGMSAHELAGLIGAYGNINHGGAVCNWEAGRNIPSREQYRKICDAIVGTGKVKSMPPYENAVRPFVMDGSKEFTDVWNFQSVRPYKGKHPAEKPASMLEHVIEASSYPGDIVLDCFAGSGSTALAALKLGRRTVALEIDPQWAAEIVARVQACGAEGVTTGLKEHDARIMQPTKLNPKVPQYALFGSSD
ncbi:MAG: DNA methyltransferase [Terriglobales bacterium]|jgi:site-specific DNA-methyltransferase (adenine-specific)